jgi:O-antigen/teichoic acid export membrane protein
MAPPPEHVVRLLSATLLADDRPAPTGAPAKSALGQPSAGRTARNAFFLGLGQAATTLLAIVLAAALARRLGAPDFGIYYVLMTMTTSAYSLLEWGQALWVGRETARTPERGGELLGTALAFRLAVSIVATIPLGVLTLTLGYGLGTTGLLVLLFLANLPIFLAQGYGIAFRAAERMGRDAAMSVTNKVLIIAVALPALAIGTGIPGIIVAQAAAGFAALVLARWLYAGMGGPPPRASRQTARALMLGGLPALSTAIAGAAQPYLEAVILLQLAPAAAVGYFGAARTIVGTLLAPAVILGTAFYPRIARAGHDATTLPGEVQAALRPVLWLAALGATGTFLFAETAVRLIYGSGFGPAATILRCYAPAIFLLFVDILLGNILFVVGKARSFAVVLAAKVVLSAGLSLVLVPVLQERTENGGIGIVLAVTLSELMVMASALALLPRGTFARHAALDTARALGAATATAFLFLVIPPVNYPLGIPLCIATFGTASWLLGLMRRRDVDTFLGIFRKRRHVVTPVDSIG